MRKVLLSTMVMTMSAGALAADLPAKTAAKATPLAPSAWSGFYAGALVGYGRGGASLSTVDDTGGFADLDTGEGTAHKPKGSIASLQVGYDWAQGSFVHGIYGSLGVSNFRSARYSKYNVVSGSDDDLFKTNSQLRGSLGVKAGHAFDFGLVYVGAGVGITKMKVSVLDNNIDSQGILNTNDTGGGSQSRWKAGLELIAGVDIPVSDRVTIGGQYTWAKFSDAAYKVAGASYENNGSLDRPDINYAQQMHNYDNHIFGLSLKYRFH